MTAGERWLSDNPDKRWAELFFLAYSPVWMAFVGLVMVSGWYRSFGDLGYLAFGLAAGAPALLGPMMLHRRYGGGRRWSHSYWLKFNLWVFVMVAGGTYYGTHYFFDLMGMTYGFPVEWTFGSAVVGRRGGEIPVFMYPLTHAYFVTYYCAMVVSLRGLTRKYGLGRLGRALVLGALAYAIAFGETFFMASEAVQGYFDYADRARMLRVGSFGYMLYFVIGVPVVERIDEDGGRWSLGRVLWEGLAAYMLVLCGLEAWAQLVGPL